jgi:ABC-type branched-subunit amino acid transport system substrate-binding protein
VKRSRSGSLLLACGALATGVAFAGCGGDDDDGGGAEPAGGEATIDLVVGDLIPLTGDLADFGPPGRKAADLAKEQIDAAIEEAGVEHTVTVEHADTATNPQEGVSAARQLVTQNDASCLAGAWASSVSIPVANSVSSREQVLQISPASTSDEITGLEDNGFMNRTAPPDSFQGPALANAIAEDLGGADGKTVNIGARNDAYGTGLADTFSAAWEEQGGQIGEQVVYDPEQPSYDSEADQIAGGNPDAYVIIDFPETYQRVGPALVRSGNWSADKTWVTDGLISGTLAEDAGAKAVNGLRGSAPGAPDEGAASEAFDTLYTEAPGPKRQTFDAQNFDAVILCYLAAVAAGSTEGPDMAEQIQGITAPGGTKYTFEELPAAIEALQNGEDIDYDGASGPIDMNEDGDATAGVYDLYRFEDGAPETFDEIPLEPQEGE